MSNIPAPSNFISLAPDAAKASSAPFVGIAAPREKKLAVLADEDFPEARWNLGGFFLYDNVRRVLHDFVRQQFLRENTIAETHGAPPCAWTLDWFQCRPLTPPNEIAALLKTVADKPTTFVLQLDNPDVPAERLNDAVGNALLTFVARMPRGAVSVASERLAEHVRGKFPSLQLRAGVNKVVAEHGRGNADYYLDAAKKFAVVAVHPDDVFDAALLEKLAGTAGADKFEITVNDTCLRGCPVRERHVAALAGIRADPWNADLLRERHRLLAEAKCEQVCGRPADAGAFPRAALFSREELKAIYALGFRRFRIQAETLRSEISFFWSALGWLFTARPERRHHMGLIATSLITRITPPVPALQSGLSPFVKRKYD